MLYYYGARYLDPKYSMWLSTDPALGEYIPQAGSDTSNLPGMGGLFNHVNHNLYHYAGNNPVKYVDPTGMWVLSLGVFASAGAGVGGSVTTGIAIGYSKEKGVTLGVFSSESIGAEFSVDAQAGVSITFDVFSDGVESGTTQTMTIGASADIGVSVGGDVTIDIDTKETDVSVGVAKSKSSGGNTGTGVKIGVGISSTAVEGHVRYNATQTKATSLKDITAPLANKLNSLDKSIKEYMINQISSCNDL